MTTQSDRNQRTTMGLSATFVLYLVIGVGVEAALQTSRDREPVARWFRVLTGILFWPLYVPVLLTLSDDETLRASDAAANLRSVSEAPRPLPRDVPTFSESRSHGRERTREQGALAQASDTENLRAAGARPSSCTDKTQPAPPPTSSPT